MTRAKLLTLHPELLKQQDLLEHMADYIRTLPMPYAGQTPSEQTALIRHEGMIMGRDTIAGHLESGAVIASLEPEKETPAIRPYSEPTQKDNQASK